jgi:hypothetical protein
MRDSLSLKVSGFLEKKGALLGRFKERRFEFDPTTMRLTYYAGLQQKGAGTVSRVDDVRSSGKRPYQFVIRLAVGRKSLAMEVSASSAGEKKRWMAGLQEALSHDPASTAAAAAAAAATELKGVGKTDVSANVDDGHVVSDKSTFCSEAELTAALEKSAPGRAVDACRKEHVLVAFDDGSGRKVMGLAVFLDHGFADYVTSSFSTKLFVGEPVLMTEPDGEEQLGRYWSLITHPLHMDDCVFFGPAYRGSAFGRSWCRDVRD